MQKGVAALERKIFEWHKSSENSEESWIIMLYLVDDEFVGTDLSGEELCRIHDEGLRAVDLRDKLAPILGVNPQIIKLLAPDENIPVVDDVLVSSKNFLYACVSMSLDQCFAEEHQCQVLRRSDNFRAHYTDWCLRKKPHVHGNKRTQWQRISAEVLFMNDVKCGKIPLGQLSLRNIWPHVNVATFRSLIRGYFCMTMKREA